MQSRMFLYVIQGGRAIVTRRREKKSAPPENLHLVKGTDILAAFQILDVR